MEIAQSARVGKTTGSDSGALPAPGRTGRGAGPESEPGAMEDVDVILFRHNARNLEMVYFEGAGHDIHDDRPTQVLDLQDAFALNKK